MLLQPILNERQWCAQSPDRNIWWLCTPHEISSNGLLVFISTLFTLYIYIYIYIYKERERERGRKRERERERAKEREVSSWKTGAMKRRALVIRITHENSRLRATEPVCVHFALLLFDRGPKPFLPEICYSIRWLKKALIEWVQRSHVYSVFLASSNKKLFSLSLSLSPSLAHPHTDFPLPLYIYIYIYIYTNVG